MSTKKKPLVNKSAAVREALAQHSDKGPAEIARLLTQRHGVRFRGKEVSTIKTKLRQRTAGPGQPAAPVAARQTAAPRPQASPGQDGVAAMVANLQVYIRRLGKEDLHGLIDTL